MKLRTTLLLGVLLSVPTTLFASEAHSRAYGPQTLVRVSRPTLRWEVWPGPGSRLTEAAMTINGQDVDPTYDSRKRVLAYTPSQPLDPGTYKVECKVVVDDCLPVTKNWNFKVAAGAISSLPEPTNDQLSEIGEINRLRRALKLPDLQVDPRLCAAAMAHTSYLDRNHMTGHYQNPGDPGFVGQSPADRLDAFGFAQGSWEGVDYGPLSASESVQRLFDAPYHRVPFLQPGASQVGAAFLPSHMTLEFGMSQETATVTSPADGQRNIPLSWHGPESPDPLAIHHEDGTCGYPIVFAHFTPMLDKIIVDGASLETALGAQVPFWLNTPANDKELDVAAFVIPRQPLSPNTGYTVTVNAHTKSGEDISRTWRFVTGSR